MSGSLGPARSGKQLDKTKAGTHGERSTNLELFMLWIAVGENTVLGLLIDPQASTLSREPVVRIFKAQGFGHPQVALRGVGGDDDQQRRILICFIVVLQRLADGCHAVEGIDVASKSAGHKAAPAGAVLPCKGVHGQSVVVMAVRSQGQKVLAMADGKGDLVEGEAKLLARDQKHLVTGAYDGSLAGSS